MVIKFIIGDSMKKVIRVLIILLCCIPLLVNALDYENGVKT